MSADLLSYQGSGLPHPVGLYSPQHEHDSCGVGFLVQLDGVANPELVQQAGHVLINLQHRGAVGGDTATGDGAGILLQLPDRLLRRWCADQGLILPNPGQYGLAMAFMMHNTVLRERCVRICEETTEREGAEFLGWRRVPVQETLPGEQARRHQPLIYQFFVAPGRIGAVDFERKLAVIRCLIEKEIAGLSGDTSDFYICSFSSHTVVYKGLLTGCQLSRYYDDLADSDFESAYALVHQRYSTNTWPTWRLAQPFRYVAHNGEINTLRANINRMRAREPLLASPVFAEDMEKIKPIIQPGGSDSACFDNVLELLVLAGRSLPHAVMMMIPEAHGPRMQQMSRDKRAFFEYHSALMEPWDGPAAIAFTDGRYVGATLDRNGLRPARYTLTRSGLIVMASETGVLDLPDDDILRRGRLQPGKMLLVDLHQNRLVPDPEVKAKLARRQPYRRWIRENRIELRGLFMPAKNPPMAADDLLRLQRIFGYSREELARVIGPMAANGQEAIGSMGNDTALAVLSCKPQLLFNYFKQLFAQVTNPPIDPLREELVMSLESFVGRECNLLQESPEQYRGLKLSHPFLTPDDLTRIRESDHGGIHTAELDMHFTADGEQAALETALQRLFVAAERAIDDGATLLLLSDRRVCENRCPIPVLLAVSGLHQHLTRTGKRNFAGIVVETGEAREVIHFALLIAFGVDAICPYLAFHSIAHLATQDLLQVRRTPEEAMDAYLTALKKGLLKCMSRMGISTLHGFFGSQIFEAVGIADDVIERFFTDTPSRLGGMGLAQIEAETRIRHRQAFSVLEQESLPQVGGVYSNRVGGEQHMWSSEAIYLLQQATRTDDYGVFKAYSREVNDRSARFATLRSLLRFKSRNSVPLDEVESEQSICRRFVTAAMSLGSISSEAHEAIAVALNRIGGRSNSGEGGEDPKRASGSGERRSRIRQVASGRFGVTPEYLIQADEIQIKMAQGAKPGEGGQLPGHKVSPEIASVRHTIPGVTLISPPPHHDIYSIEDLSQLIYDLRAVNPNAVISVKLVAEAGVGTIAAGVAKAQADLVLISGHDGGTGASPLTAIHHAGLPWELGLAETQQTLMINGLRDRIRVQVDGQLKTGRDLAIAALLGAEEFGFGTAVLVTLGCVLMRKCHLNTCPVGVATQDERLRSRFRGKAIYVERFLRFIAMEMREYLAQLGFRTIDEMVGRVDCLEFDCDQVPEKARTLNLERLLQEPPVSGDAPRRSAGFVVRCDPHSLDEKLIRRAQPALVEGKTLHLEERIRNIHRAVGAGLSRSVVQHHGSKGLPEDTLQLSLVGSAGQSFGAFLAPGIRMHLIGDANDYVGKGMAGGTIILSPPAGARFAPHENTIVGNVVLYGATGGRVFINGLAGERFAVRNSGAVAVVEGVGDHGC
ncbi:glutamate synthase large subunit, partial [candidate division KSB1 bacterium]|nr:glutamate synthase large subunit [candidate division KSB1 bacterium]